MLFEEEIREKITLYEALQYELSQKYFVIARYLKGKLLGYWNGTFFINMFSQAEVFKGVEKVGAEIEKLSCDEYKYKALEVEVKLKYGGKNA